MPLTKPSDGRRLKCACSKEIDSWSGYYIHVVTDCPLLRCHICLTWLPNPELEAHHTCPGIKLIRIRNIIEDVKTEKVKRIRNVF